MRVHLIHRSRGTEREDSLEGDTLGIGRDAGNAIVLKDFRIPLRRATLRIKEGMPWIISDTDQPLWISGSPGREAPLREGLSIEFGRFMLEVGPVSHNELTLIVVARYEEDEVREQYRGRMRASLEELGLPMRAIAWGLALVTLLAGLALPWYYRFGAPGVEAPQPMPARADHAWLSGPLTDVHAHFGDDCAQCHRQPFRTVGDAECLACHDDTAAHGSSREFPDIAAIATECTDCHLEHEPSRRITLENAQLCTGCHADPDNSAAPPARSFSGDHPPFDHERDGALAGGGLRFPHDLHLHPDGVRGPDGRRTLDCADCHRPDDGGGFHRVTMAANCQGCHALGVDPGNPAREVPHARLDVVREAVRQFRAQEILEAAVPARDLRRPAGSQERRLRAARARGDASADRLFAEIVESRLCTTCHYVTDTGDADMPYAIEAVDLPERYFRGVRFDHGDHRTQACADCHAARESTEAVEVLLPDSAQCQQCHGRPADHDVGLSTCTVCHRFHDGGAHWTTVREASP